MPRSNIEHTCKYMQVLVVSLYVSKKKNSCIFRAMPTKCIAARCSKTTIDGVSLQSGLVHRLYSALYSVHFEPSCFESGIQCTTLFDMKRKVILKHDTIPTIFLASGKSKKVPERRDEPRGEFA